MSVRKTYTFLENCKRLLVGKKNRYLYTTAFGIKPVLIWCYLLLSIPGKNYFGKDESKSGK